MTFMSIRVNISFAVIGILNTLKSKQTQVDKRTLNYVKHIKFVKSVVFLLKDLRSQRLGYSEGVM